MSFPTKEIRKTCWDSRDTYWQCLDANTIKNSNSRESAEPPKECVKLRKLFEKNCPPRWVEHFDRRRTYELFKEKMEKGYDPLEELPDSKK